jgi:hypothetical protein
VQSWSFAFISDAGWSLRRAGIICHARHTKKTHGADRSLRRAGYITDMLKAINTYIAVLKLLFHFFSLSASEKLKL